MNKVNVTLLTITFEIPEGTDVSKLIDKYYGYSIYIQGNKHVLTKESLKWIKENLQAGHYNEHRPFIYVDQFLEFEKNKQADNEEELTVFDKIRDWANTRGLYEKGDVKTQYVKLQEESGELARSIIKNDQEEFKDAVGDIIVVLTNLCEINGEFTIEQAVESAYDVIKERKGKMIDGSFVKN